MIGVTAEYQATHNVVTQLCGYVTMQPLQGAIYVATRLHGFTSVWLCGWAA